MKNYVNFHVLISHSPSCLNRDDMNMQKSAVFGGVRRVRISSQSLKRALRKSDYYREHLGEVSVRSRSLARLKEWLVTALADEFEPTLVEECIDLFVMGKSKDDNGDVSGEDEREPPESDGEESSAKNKVAVAPWAVAEIRGLCRIVAAAKREGLAGEELEKIQARAKNGKAKKAKSAEQLIEEELKKKIAKAVETQVTAFRAAAGSALDIALSGRMATSGLMTSVDGALAVAHVLTTHAVDSDIDWFTAVDDLVTDAGETGAGHLNTQEFSSGVFYRYASLNLKQLQENLGGATRERVLEVAGHLAHLLATVVPTAKQQSFAAHNLADAVLVSFSDMPVSLSNAFEQPVTFDDKSKGSGYRAPSLKKLLGHWQNTNRAYGLNEDARLFAMDDLESESAPARLPTLAALKQWISRDGQN